MIKTNVLFVLFLSLLFSSCKSVADFSLEIKNIKQELVEQSLLDLYKKNVIDSNENYVFCLYPYLMDFEINNEKFKNLTLQSHLAYFLRGYKGNIIRVTGVDLLNNNSEAKLLFDIWSIDKHYVSYYVLESIDGHWLIKEIHKGGSTPFGIRNWSVPN